MLSLTMDAEPEALVSQAAIHELTTPSADVMAVVDLLERMGLGGRIRGLEWERDFNWVTAGDSQVVVSVNEVSGGLQYRLRPLADEPGTEVSASPSRLETIARDFLDRIGRPDDAMRLERITYLRVEGAAPGEAPTSVSTLDAGLVFTRTVDDLPVVGAGGMVMVKIGTDETVVGGREVWRPIAQRGSNVPLRSPQEATDLLRARLAKAGLDGEVHVVKAQQGYAESGIEEAQRYLEPCYAFVVETAGGRIQSKKVEVIPAARVGPLAAAFAAG